MITVCFNASKISRRSWRVTCLLWLVYLGHAQTIVPGHSLPTLLDRETGARTGLSTVANIANKQVSLAVRSVLFIYLSIASQGHSKCCYCSVVIIELWAIGDPSLRSWSSSWRIGDSRNLVKGNGIKIFSRRGKPPWFAFFLPNAKIWAYFKHFRVRSINRIPE